MILTAAFIRATVDDRFFRKAIHSASGWADQIVVFGEADPAGSVNHEVYVDLPLPKRESHIRLQSAWSELGFYVNDGEWVVFLYGDEFVHYGDALRQAIRSITDTKWIGFYRYFMADEANYRITPPYGPHLSVRGARYHSGYMEFLPTSFTTGDIMPRAHSQIANPVTDILAYRWLDVTNRMLYAPDMKDNYWDIAKWDKGNV